MFIGNSWTLVTSQDNRFIHVEAPTFPGILEELDRFNGEIFRIFCGPVLIYHNMSVREAYPGIFPICEEW